MTWSYSPTTLATSQKDQVRLLVGDTDPTDQLLMDEEINFAISQRLNIYFAAIQVVNNLIAKYSRFVSVSADGASIQYSQRIQNWKLLVGSLTTQANSSAPPVPFAGGISVTDKQSTESEADRVTPQFTIGQDDNLTATGDPAFNLLLG